MSRCVLVADHFGQLRKLTQLGQSRHAGYPRSPLTVVNEFQKCHHRPSPRSRMVLLFARSSSALCSVRPLLLVRPTPDRWASRAEGLALSNATAFLRIS